MKHYFNPLSRTLLVLLSVGLSAACSDKWDKHYSIDPSVTQSTILDNLKSNAEASNFVEVLKTTKVMNGDKTSDLTYEQLFDGDQFFTVWAPLNNSLTQDEWREYMKPDKTAAENKQVVKTFLNNHVSRMKYSNDGTEKRILTMSSKHYLMTKDSLETAAIKESNIPCTNGIMYTLSSKLEYKPNIYEYLTSSDSPYAETLGAFLLKHTKMELNKEKSVSAGYYNEKAELVYADSVMELKNPVFDEFGFFNEEDSTYNLILPVGGNWLSALDSASVYFHYGLEARQDSDSLSEYKSNCALLTDAVFNMNTKMQPYYNAASGMKMVSTKYDLVEDPVKQVQYHTYVDPFKDGKFQGKYEFLDVIPCSNGNIYVCEYWPFDPFYTYAKPVVVEAEDDKNIVTSQIGMTTTVLTLPSFQIGEKTCRLSDDKALIGNYNQSWFITFQAPNTLSGWNSFYAVIAPNNLAYNRRGQAAEVNKFQLSGTMTGVKETFQQKQGARAVTYSTNPEKLDTVYAGTYFLPDCYSDLNIAGLMLKFNQTLSTSATLRQREVYIDCLIVKPTTAPEN